MLWCVLSGSELVTLITSGPVLTFELQGENAIQHWQDLLGPEDSAVARSSNPSSIRARYGTGMHAIHFDNNNNDNNNEHITFTIE